MAIVSEAVGPVPSANGELINRVQQLRLDGQLGRATTGSSRGSWLPWVLCGMMAVAWTGIGARWYRTPDASESVAAKPSAGSGNTNSGEVPTSNAKSNNQQNTAAGALLLQAKGILTPFLQIDLSPDDVAGVVEYVYFKEGDRVKKGDVIARIRNTRYLNDYNAAEASLRSAQCRWDELDPKSVRPIEIHQAQAELDEAEANRVRSKQDLERITTQKAMGVVSGQDIDKAFADLKGAEARVIRLKKALDILVEGPRKEKLQGALADIQNSKARLEECKRLLENCNVRSPIDGTILTKSADPGVVVSPMSYKVATGICSMADLSDMEAEIDVREDQITAIQTGQECQLTATADPNRTYKGRVDRIMPIADDGKGIIKVRVKVQLPPKEEPGSFLKPKMSSVVRIYNKIVPPINSENK